MRKLINKNIKKRANKKMLKSSKIYDPHLEEKANLN